MSSIDFVIPWVDGNDPEWRKQKRKVCSEFMDDRPQRYRDWGLLRYWFRGVEAFTPWVNRIHFITWGHLPPWLNTQHPKLHIVRHEDYIPAEYLPTFSSHVIELNMHKVDGLSRQFVYFNDDMFLLRPLKETDFFRNGLPCDSALMNPVATDDLCKPGNGGKIFSIPYNNVQYLNRDFDMRQSMKEHWRKWCDRRDLNPYPLLDTPLKRARMPIPPRSPMTAFLLYRMNLPFVNIQFNMDRSFPISPCHPPKKEYNNIV